MSISVINPNTKLEVSKIPLPSFVEKYKDASTQSIAKVFFTSKKISFTKTANTKGISDVSGTTKKPFKQKGTGNARQGSLRSPQFRGGGIIFGPKPVTAVYKINKKEKNHAKMVLIAKLISQNAITIFSEINVAPYKTKEAKKFVDGLQIDGRVAIIHNDEISYESLKSFSNIPLVGVYSVSSFHLYEIVKYDHIVFTEKAFNKFIEVL